jgi:hypothetical protein
MSQSLSSAIAAELSRRVLAASPADDSDTSSDEPGEEARSSSRRLRIRAALSDLVDATLGDELTVQARAAIANNAKSAGGNREALSATEDDSSDMPSLAARAADGIASSAPAYALLEDAVRQAAAAAAAAADDDGAASGHKKPKRDADAAVGEGGGTGGSKSDPFADQVWGANGDDEGDNDDDPLAADADADADADANANADADADANANANANANASTGLPIVGAAGTTSGGGKSFSLFDMLDSQQGIMGGLGAAAERVSAQQILRAFGLGADDATGGGDPRGRFHEAASLLERVDDLEDLLFDPFGSCAADGGGIGGGGDVWPDIDRVLRSGLGLGGDASVPPPSPPLPPDAPLPDVIVRYARIHSQLNGLCGVSSSSSGIDFGPQRIDLLVNVADALVAMHYRLESRLWYSVEELGEVQMNEDAVTLVQIMLDMLISSAPALELAPEEDCQRLLLSVLKIVTMEPTSEKCSIGLAHAVSATDPYAEWFSLISRFVHPAALIKATTETGILKSIVQLCNEGPGRRASVKPGTASVKGSDMVVVGIIDDLDHCLYLHSLSMLRTLLVVTAASESIFPYQEIGIDSSDSLSQNVTRVLSPFIQVLSVGAKKGTAVVDKCLASLCEEASGTVLRGIKQNKEVLGTALQTIDPAAVKETMATNHNPSIVAITRLQRLTTYLGS